MVAARGWRQLDPFRRQLIRGRADSFFRIRPSRAPEIPERSCWNWWSDEMIGRKRLTRSSREAATSATKALQRRARRSKVSAAEIRWKSAPLLDQLALAAVLDRRLHH